MLKLVSKSPVLINSIISRSMSSTASSLREYVVIVKDFPGTLDQRLKVRAQHMDGAKADNQMSLMPTGGGIADEFPNEGEQFQFVGSMLLMKAENKDKVVERLKKDIYATSGVWDVDNAQIYANCKLSGLFYRVVR